MLSAKLLLLSLEAVRAGKSDEALELLRTVARSEKLSDEAAKLLLCEEATTAPMIGLSSVLEDEEDDPAEGDDEWDDLIPGARVIQTTLASDIEVGELKSSVSSPVGIKRA